MDVVQRRGIICQNIQNSQTQEEHAEITEWRRAYIVQVRAATPRPTKWFETINWAPMDINCFLYNDRKAKGEFESHLYCNSINILLE